MSHKVLHTEEWYEDHCDTCGHSKESHYLEPKEVIINSRQKYIASGCMSFDSNGRKLEGNNPHLRCKCLEFK
jgi:hypothetical protein